MTASDKFVSVEKPGWAKHFLGISGSLCPGCGSDQVYYGRSAFATHYRCAPCGRAWFAKGEHTEKRSDIVFQRDNIHRVIVIIGDLEDRYGGAAPVEEIMRIAESEGIKRSFVEELIEQEKQRGHLYEPKKDMITRAVK